MLKQSIVRYLNFKNLVLTKLTICIDFNSGWISIEVYLKLIKLIQGFKKKECNLRIKLKLKSNSFKFVSILC